MIYRNNYGPIDRFCAKHPRFGINNLILFLVIAQAGVFVLDLICALFMIISPFAMTFAYEFIMGIYLVIGGISLLTEILSEAK